MRSLKRLENEFLKDPKMKTAYVNFVNEYIEMGRMTKVEPTSGPKYFIPHRAVFREESTTTPLRVVFNASFSCKKKGISLNDALMIGPVLFNVSFLKFHYRCVVTNT